MFLQGKKILWYLPRDPANILIFIKCIITVGGFDSGLNVFLIVKFVEYVKYSLSFHIKILKKINCRSRSEPGFAGRCNSFDR